MDHTPQTIKYPQTQQQQTVRDIVSIFFIKKSLFVGTFLTVVIAAFLVSVLYPPIYEVHGKLVVRPQIETPMVFDKDVSRVNFDSRVDIQMINTVIELISSPDVMRKVVIKHQLVDLNDEIAIQKESLALIRAFKAEPLSLSNIIDVRLRGDDPQEVSDLLNSIIDSYIGYHINVNQTSKSSLEFFDRQTEQFKDRFHNLTTHLADESRRLQVSNPMLQKENILVLIKDLEFQEAAAKVKVSSLIDRKSMMLLAQKKVRDNDRWIGLPNDILETFPALVEMSKSMAQLIINKQKANDDYLPGSKQVNDAENQYSNMRQQIYRHMGIIVDGLDTKLASKRREVDELAKGIDEAQARLSKLTAEAINLEQLELEHSLAKDNYTLYSVKREEARINLEKDQALFANVSIATRPVPPLSPWFPQKTKIMMIAVLFALLLAMGVSMAAYTLDQTIVMPNDIISKTRIRYLGSLDDVSS